MKDNVAHTSFPARCGARLLGALVAVTFVIGGCTREEDRPAKTSLPQRVVTVTMAAPQEALDMVQEVALQFNAASAQSHGDIRVQLEVREGGAVSTGLKIMEGKSPLGLWLAPSSLAVAVANRRGEGAGIKLEQCASLMSTQPAIAYRPSDAFHLAGLLRPLNLEELLTQISVREKDTIQPPTLIGSAPLLSTSGFAGLLLTAAIASKGAVYDLASGRASQPEAVAAQSELLAPYVHFFTSGRHMLSWLRGLDGGRAVLALTTVQEAAVAGAPEDVALEAIPIDTPALTLDYPLCVVGLPYQKELDRDAVRIVRSFFLSDPVQAIAKRFGFQGRVETQPPASPDMVMAIETLLADWSRRKSPTGITVVLDTSAGVKGSVLLTLSGLVTEVSHAIPGGRGISGLISCAQLPEKVIVTGGAGASLEEGLKGLHASGGLAFRDCLIEALQLAAFNTATSGAPQRREILAFISSDDTSSQIPMERFMGVASQLVRQSRPGLHVVGVGSDITSFGKLPQMIQSLGGRFFLAPPGEPLRNVVAQVRQAIE